MRIAGMAIRSGKLKNSRVGIIQAITTPLGFYVLTLLIVEATLCVVLVGSKLDSTKIWYGFLWMVGVFIGVIILVTVFAWFNPTNLLYGKEEYSNPALDSSALRDTIEDTIVDNVKAECLKKVIAGNNIKT
jgi:hypothetical protein